MFTIVPPQTWSLYEFWQNISDTLRSVGSSVKMSNPLHDAIDESKTAGKSDERLSQLRNGKQNLWFLWVWFHFDSIQCIQLLRERETADECVSSEMCVVSRWIHVYTTENCNFRWKRRQKERGNGTLRFDEISCFCRFRLSWRRLCWDGWTGAAWAWRQRLVKLSVINVRSKNLSETLKV